jgi:hypothetical protein
MNVRRALFVATAALAAMPVARSGHEQSVYPSYYPHEIEIATIAPEQAGDLMRAGKLHAYVGSAPLFASAVPEGIGSVESLGSFVLVRLNRQSPLAKDEASACAAVGALVRDMAARAHANTFVAHPYPVTPWHGDYLLYADRAEAAQQRLLRGDTPSPPAGLKVRAEGALVRSLVRPDWLVDDTWDAAVEEVSAAELVADATVALNGWLGPRWLRSGWFHAYRLLGGTVTDPTKKEEVHASVARLQTAAYDGSVERINLERQLVELLSTSCRLVVAGYTVKRESYNAQFSAGIENISYDALQGLSSPMFLRTVKLKDFPWNGWLQLAVGSRPASAWNPIGGFTDAFGRLMWFAIGDPAAIPSPYDAGWTLNRFSEVEAAPRR